MDSASITTPSDIQVDVPKPPAQLSLRQTDSEHSNLNNDNSAGTPRDGEISSLTSGKVRCMFKKSKTGFLAQILKK